MTRLFLLVVLFISFQAVQVHANFVSFVRSLPGKYERRNFWLYWYLYKKRHEAIVQGAQNNSTLLNNFLANATDLKVG
jgi:hypothetical protein